MYSSESVIAALKSNNELSFEGIDDVKCPSSVSDVLCLFDPYSCAKGFGQKCKQPVIVFHKYQKLTILIFRFMVSPENHGGFIHEKDSSLLRLINHGFVDETLLSSV